MKKVYEKLDKLSSDEKMIGLYDVEMKRQGLEEHR